jgi:hypothetical protein
VGKVQIVPTADLICTGPHGRCPAAVDGVLIRYDGVHFTARFSRRLVPQLIDRAVQRGLVLGPKPGTASP